jgi:hypothetical protein
VSYSDAPALGGLQSRQKQRSDDKKERYPHKRPSHIASPDDLLPEAHARRFTLELKGKTNSPAGGDLGYLTAQRDRRPEGPPHSSHVRKGVETNTPHLS